MTYQKHECSLYWLIRFPTLAMTVLLDSLGLAMHSHGALAVPEIHLLDGTKAERYRFFMAQPWCAFFGKPGKNRCPPGPCQIPRKATTKDSKGVRKLKIKILPGILTISQAANSVPQKGIIADILSHVTQDAKHQ